MRTVFHKRIIIIGAGFAGLYAAQRLSRDPVEIILIDRNNFHTFTPLLYQVATCGLDPSSIAYPIRSIFRRRKNVHFLMGDVTDIDSDNQRVAVEVNGHTHYESYDYLLVATGSVSNYFNQVNLERFTFGVKDLNDAVLLRQHIMRLFERAAWTADDKEREALMTLVVVGGGPTGLETAGALYELYNFVLKEEYSDQRPLSARVILIEAMDNLLGPYPDSLQDAAVAQLKSLGVELILGQMVSDIGPDYLELKDGTRINTYTVVWTAGVKASPLAEQLGVELSRGGRVPVEKTMEVQGLERVYVAGDLAYLERDDNERDAGKPYPMLIPVAKQQGILVAKNIKRRLNNQPQEDFKYQDRGIMATIGRTRAVAWIFYRFQITGYFAWLAWLMLHLVTLLGFRNRMSVFINWVWNYFTYDRSVRLVIQQYEDTTPMPMQYIKNGAYTIQNGQIEFQGDEIPAPAEAVPEGVGNGHHRHQASV